ncbi:MAG: class II glutamine amidotransferase [Bacteroidia bacterium]|nr:class II glutamine amidotransferase [Bacteroidia bacterium]MDW8333072.1 class II glutamine amidotransferase [Bacteroidia bacterium]
MTERLGHECGLAVLRLKKPLQYFEDKYSDALWGLRRMYLLLEKQQNRGQDGAGLGAVRLDVPAGVPFMVRKRVVRPVPCWQSLIVALENRLEGLRARRPEIDIQELYRRFPFAAEILVGHLRYGTYGGLSLDNCHPVCRVSNWRSRSLMLAGNFNLTNPGAQFRKLVRKGQHPLRRSDTFMVLERMAYFLERQVDELFKDFHVPRPDRPEKKDNVAFSQYMKTALDVEKWLTDSSEYWDGGYVLAGATGQGYVFVMRDPHGIRPGYVYENEEIWAAASERSALATALDVHPDDAWEIEPGTAAVVNPLGRSFVVKFRSPGKRARCTFERIYFSRGTDPQIYRERKALGAALADRILKHVEIENAVFTYIPNTARAAFRGLVEALERRLDQEKKSFLLRGGTVRDEELTAVLARHVRAEELVVKDTLLRTFISDDKSRVEMAAHVYDVTRGVLREDIDSLVCMDDSIVRGTTLKSSILTMLARLRPRKIVFVSSAPPICYPDCYGIDMSQLEKFVAFQAAVALLKETGRENVVHETYRKCKALFAQKKAGEENAVKAIYEPFELETLSAKVAELVRPPHSTVPLTVVYQSLEGLKKAMSESGHEGMWYFDGNYPTEGGNIVANRAFIHFYENKSRRAY